MDGYCNRSEPGFHMIATIAVIAAIAEKKRVQRSYGNHSPAIAATGNDRTFYISAIVVAAIAEVFFSDHSDGSDHMVTGL